MKRRQDENKEEENRCGPGDEMMRACQSHEEDEMEQPDLQTEAPKHAAQSDLWCCESVSLTNHHTDDLRWVQRLEPVRGRAD